MILLCILSVTAYATVHLWPIPAKVQLGSSACLLSPQVEFKLNCRDEALELLQKALPRYKTALEQAFKPTKVKTLPSTHCRIERLEVKVESSDVSLKPDTDESYSISIDAQGKSEIKSKTVYGVMRGLETFTQIFEMTGNDDVGMFVAPLSINDEPKFKHRGVLLDTARSFYPLDDIYRIIDAMAMVKLNVFHWHIVDSQSFPVQSKVFPRLWKEGAYSQSMVYSREDIENVQEFALIRGIRVIPEFDSPGHTFSWGLGYPELTVCKNVQPGWGKFAAEPPSGQLNIIREDTIKFVQQLFKEQTEWFKDSYFHIGGDEVNKNCYENVTEIVQYMNEDGKGTVDIISEFIDKVKSFIIGQGKKPVVWEEAVLEYSSGKKKDMVVQVWKGSNNVKNVTSLGYDTIVSPYDYWYLDCGQGEWINTKGGGQSWCDPLKSWRRVYSYDPLVNLTATETSRVLGGEVCLWSELTDAVNVDHRLWPRAAAAAEVLWSKEKQTTKEALPRMLTMRRRLVQRGVRADMVQMLWCEMHPGDCEMP